MQDLKILTNDQLLNEFDNAKRLINHLETKAPKVDRADVHFVLDKIKEEILARGLSEPAVDLTKKKSLINN